MVLLAARAAFLPVTFCEFPLRAMCSSFSLVLYSYPNGSLQDTNIRRQYLVSCRRNLG
jgi:hypothetical protein